MSAFRERPRVIAAQVAGVILLLVIGFLLGGAAKGDTKADPALTERVERLERQNVRLKGQLRDSERQADKAEATTKRQARGFQRRIRRAAAREVRFRRALRRARAAND